MPVGRSRRVVEPPQDVDEPAEVTEPEPEPEPETTEPEAAPESAEQPVLQEFAVRKPAGKRLKGAVVAAAALFVAAAAFAGATLQPYLADRALVRTKLDIARTAASAITTLWTYTPDNMDSLPDRASRYLAGDFESAYRKYVDGIASTNKQAQVSNSTQVLGAAVESVGPADATAIVYTNSTAVSPVTKNIPSLRYVSYRLTMERRDARWLVTKMTTVTSVDLTPQL
jgi:Mce-associated membrane protein